MCIKILYHISLTEKQFRGVHYYTLCINNNYYNIQFYDNTIYIYEKFGRSRGSI